ncbi:hypothetical protein HPB47_006978 [Ixodes persulcatus]|uniref:Uncharacterized protein n=1 Tax=Ixodes persulcatus TaxID=34615 RepID=A0AC60P8K9_IXOPE|nr:hypothetical protein HPB47_006978 [Ixodes persulcatus]
MDLAVRQRLRYSHFGPHVRSLQELCQRSLVSTSSLYRWKQMTDSLPDGLRRSICVLSSEYFSGCSVDLYLHWIFTKNGHPSYRVRCSLDQQRYLAVRAAVGTSTLRTDDDFWRWSRLNHTNLLSILAVAVDGVKEKVFVITALPEDALERFVSQLSCKFLCVKERFLWKFLRQLCSVLRYIELEGLLVEDFDVCNVYLRQGDVMLNNSLTWKQKPRGASSLPGDLWKLLFGSACSQFLDEDQRTSSSVGLVLAQLVVLALAKDSAAADQGRQAQERPNLHGVELAEAPLAYSDKFIRVLAELHIAPTLSLDVAEQRAADMVASLFGEDPLWCPP